MALIFFLCALAALFFFSKNLTGMISYLLFRLTKSQNLSIHLMAFLFLPGVIIHELSHWLVANLLFVPTGEIEFYPQIHGDRVKLGSVAVAKTDIFRRFLVGIAPLVGGIGLLLLFFSFLTPAIVPFTYKSLIFLYVLFEIGNTMFSSKKDMEGALGMGILLFLFFLVMLFFKLPLLSILGGILSQPAVIHFLWQAGSFCFLALGIDAVFFLLLVGILRRL